MNSAWGAFGRRSACADRERRPAFAARRAPEGPKSARRPSVNGRPAPTEERRRRRRPTLGVQRLGRPILIGTEAFGRRSACADRGTSLASAKADAWRAAPWKADFNRHEGLRPTVGLRRPRNVACVGEGRRLACSALEGRFQSARRPSADGRPAPTGGLSFASAKADAWRAAPWKADFNRHGGLRPTVGLRRPEECLLRRRRPTPGA
jgi:hypothetical protein